MQSASADFKTAIAATDREIRGYLQFSNGFILSGAGGLISFKATQTAMDSERFCVGSVTSDFCEASFYNVGLENSGVSLANSYFDAYVGVVTDPSDDTTEYVCCGRFYISEITRSSATTRIVGYDIAGRLSMNYVPTVTPDPDDGYLVMDVLNDIIDQTGVNGGTHFTTYGDDVYVAQLYEGNCRQQWGWLTTLVDEDCTEWSGNREPADLGYVKGYYLGNGEADEYAIDDSVVYLDGLNVGDPFEIQSYTTGTNDNPIVSGNGVGAVGQNPYIDQATADAVFANIEDYTYTPLTIRWRGNPCLDIMDEIAVTIGEDTYLSVAMKIVTTFNGGLEQTITCYGDSEAFYELSTSPTDTKINTVSNMLKEVVQSIETADGGVITKILDTDGTWKELVIANNQDLSQATSVWRWNINGLAHSTSYTGGTYSFALDDQGRLIANVIQTGVLQDAQGHNSWNLDTGAMRITDGSIDITTNSASDDKIKLVYGNYSLSLTPSSALLTDTGNGVEAYISANGVFLYDTNLNPNVPLASLQAGSLNFFNQNASQTASYPNGVDFSNDVSVYNSRGTLTSYVCRKWGNFRFVNLIFQSDYTGTTSTEKIAELGANNAPNIDCALTCADVTSGTGYVDSYVPCKVSPNGSIFMNHATNGHRYAITGTYYCTTAGV